MGSYAGAAAGAGRRARGAVPRVREEFALAFVMGAHGWSGDGSADRLRRLGDEWLWS